MNQIKVLIDVRNLKSNKILNTMNAIKIIIPVVEGDAHTLLAAKQLSNENTNGSQQVSVRNNNTHFRCN